jgi:peptidoglycan-associated lipoprotein
MVIWLVLLSGRRIFPLYEQELIMALMKRYCGSMLAFALLALAGCASTTQETGSSSAPEIQEPETSMEVEEVVVEIEPIKPMVSRGKIILPLDAMDAAAGSETLRGMFYFDFDQAIVRRSGHSELDRHATVLSGNSMLSVRLEGHADERGTREYNLALGERRANAVQAYLIAQGVSRSQMEVISYGEEKPADSGHDESSWRQNRRVEIVYR